MKAKFSKRLQAYLIDIVLLFLLMTFISPIIPKTGDVGKITSDMEQIMQDYTDKKYDEKEFTDKLLDVSYRANKSSYLSQIVSICLYLGYFVVMPIFTKGQTLGKKITKLRIVRNDGKDVGGNSLLFRSILLYGIAANIINLILLLVTSKSLYLNVSGTISMIFNLLLAVSMVMVLVRQDGRGLHDLIGGTKVITIEEESGV